MSFCLAALIVERYVAIQTKQSDLDVCGFCWDFKTKYNIDGRHCNVSKNANELPIHWLYAGPQQKTSN